MTNQDMLDRLQLMLVCLHDNEVFKAQKLFNEVMWGLRDNIEREADVCDTSNEAA